MNILYNHAENSKIAGLIGVLLKGLPTKLTLVWGLGT